MENQDKVINQLVAEGRCITDTPLTETEMESFDKFYRGFLNKKLEDKLSLLKSMLLVRRGDLRKYIQYAVLFQNRYEGLISVKQRDLLLSFPFVCKEIYNLIFSCMESYGDAGKTVVDLTKEQVNDHLDRTEMFRIDLDTLLCSTNAIVPESKKMLEEYFSSPNQTPQEKSFKFCLVILADHPIISILPHTERNNTLAIAKVREYLEENFGERFEENPVEFFVVGGGYIRREDEKIMIGGRSNIFDPLFDDTTKPLSELYSGRFLAMKYQLVEQILKLEFPDSDFVINTKPGKPTTSFSPIASSTIPPS
ncbi:MAG: hypothetical protein HY819_18960 [Acidobacteria bacterium]|nr:hypothetical protein [Acidobacteriota bacterium]